MESTGSNSTNESSAQPRRRRKCIDKILHDVCVIIGTLIMLLFFSMLLKENFENAGWDGSTNHKIAIGASLLGLSVFTLMFGFYTFGRIRNIFCAQMTPQESENAIEPTNNQQIILIKDVPPSYERVMGAPPSYFSVIMTKPPKIDDKFKSNVIESYI